MYIETSRPRLEGEKARLVSPVFSVAPKNPYGATNTAYCFSFYYHMYGQHIGSLNVYLRLKGQTAIENPLWSSSGNKGQHWNQARVNINPPTSFQLIFEGIRGPGIEGDIAIDDVSIVEGECMKSDQPANSKWLFYTLGRANCFLSCRIEVSLKWMSCRRAKYHWVKSERLRVKSFPFCLHSRGRSPWCRKAPSAWGGVAIRGLSFWQLQMVPDGQTDKAVLEKWLGGRKNMKLINRHVAIACGPSFIPHL
uniref:MAM domain-containing protein n=1 Tax=Anas zonorhyncha TaxID=75864 RepID=A0A8B9UQR0_9AVES